MVQRITFTATTILVCIITVAAPCCEGVGLCPSGWTFWGTHCYRYFSVSLNWFSAERFCNQFGTIHEGSQDQLAHLVSIHSEVENIFIRSLWESLRNPDRVKERCWIGLTDEVSEGDFLWSDQTVSDYTKWAHGQPNNNKGNQNCAALVRIDSGAFVGSWDDGYCSLPLPFMCKMLPYDPSP